MMPLKKYQYLPSPLWPCLEVTCRGDAVISILWHPMPCSTKSLLPAEHPCSKMLSRYFHGRDHSPNLNLELLLLEGTEFQVKVWQHLLLVSIGTMISYQSFTLSMGLSTAHTRAVASAVGKNPFMILYPCHRIVPSLCSAKNLRLCGHYQGGHQVKKQLLKFEST